MTMPFTEAEQEQLRVELIERIGLNFFCRDRTPVEGATKPDFWDLAILWFAAKGANVFAALADDPDWVGRRTDALADDAALMRRLVDMQTWKLGVRWGQPC